MANQGSIEPLVLSGSTDGRPIAVAATSSPGTTIHTATSTSTERDYIDIYAANVDGSARTLTLQWGGTSTADQIGPVSLAANSGDTLIVVNKPLQNSLVVKAYGDSASKVNITGNVRRVTL